MGQIAEQSSRNRVGIVVGVAEQLQRQEDRPAVTLEADRYRHM